MLWRWHEYSPLRTAAVVAIAPQMLDLGDIPAGGVRPFDFTLTNRATIPLSIKSIATSCKCVNVFGKGTTTKPNQSLTLHGAINDTEPGVKERQVVLDVKPGHPVMLPVRYTVKRLLFADPADVYIEDVTTNHVVQEISLASDLSVLPTLRSVTTSTPQIEISKTQRKGERWVLSVLTRKGASSYDQIRGEVVVEAKEVPGVTLHIPVSTVFTGEISVRPRMLYLGGISEGERSECRLRIKKVAGAPLEIREREVPSYCTLRVITSTDSEAELLISVTPTEKGVLNDRLVLDGGDSREIEVPIRAIVL